MDKGVTARQNIALMRYARAVGVNLAWNLLYAFPGDHVADYEQTLALIPLLRHLNPPGGLSFLSIDRFSPYFDFPERYGITNMRPMKSYFSVFPATANIEKLAYHFVGDYGSGSRETPELMKNLETEVDQWMSLWNKQDEALPALAVTSLAEDTFLLMDTRGLEDTEEIQFLDRDQASLILAGRRLDERDDNVEWALEAKLIVELDRLFVPLATAEPALLREFEAEQRKKLHGSVVRQSLPVIPAVLS